VKYPTKQAVDNVERAAVTLDNQVVAVSLNAVDIVELELAAVAAVLGGDKVGAAAEDIGVVEVISVENSASPS